MEVLAEVVYIVRARASCFNKDSFLDIMNIVCVNTIFI